MIKNIIAATIFLISGIAGAQTSSGSSDKNEAISMHDLNKTLELCRSLDHSTLRIYCPAASQACAGAKDFEGKRACLEQQGK